VTTTEVCGVKACGREIVTSGLCSRGSLAVNAGAIEIAIGIQGALEVSELFLFILFIYLTLISQI